MENIQKAVTAECKWCYDDICCNDRCPVCADYCPVPETPGVCRFEERDGRNQKDGECK